MKRIVFTTLTIVGMIVPGVALAAERNQKDKDHNDDGCSVSTLSGSYLFTGEAASPEPLHHSGYPRRFAGVYTFDGEGNMAGVASRSLGGVVTELAKDSATHRVDDDRMGH